MKYEERTRFVGQWLQKVLRRYTPPSGMDNETLREEMILIVEDVNKNLPPKVTPESIKNLLDKIDGQVRASQSSRTWPTIKLFVTATQDCTKAYMNSSKAIAGSTVFSLDPLSIAETRIINGEAVSDSYIREGKLRDQLLARGKVTKQDVNKYLAPDAQMQ